MFQELEESKSTKSMDGRQKRTRLLLHKAFLDLLDSKRIDEITIREIAAEAGIGHATFYRHYRTKEELLKDLAADELHHMIKITLPISVDGELTQSWNDTCEYIDQHRPLWTTLLTGGAADTLKYELLRISLGVAQEVLSDQPDLDQEILQLRVSLSVTAMLETFAWWLRQEKPLPPSHIAEYLDNIIQTIGKLG